MATVVTAHCTHCAAEVKIRPEGVHVYVYSSKWPTDYYAFFCPECKGFVQKDADEHIVQLLRDANVATTLIHVPLEVIERKAMKKPLTNDDVLNLLCYLRDHDTMPDVRGRVRK